MNDVDVDTTELKALKARLLMLSESGDKVIVDKVLDDVSMRFLRKVRQKTPVKTGALRNHWSQENTEKMQIGTTHKVVITNPMSYAEYVEYGHLSGNSWTSGRFMVSKSEAELERTLPALVQKDVEKFIREALNVK